VAARDSGCTVADNNGLDVAALVALTAAGRPLKDHPRGRKLDRDAVIDTPRDIWIPEAPRTTETLTAFVPVSLPRGPTFLVR